MAIWARFRWASGQVRGVFRPALAFEFWSTLIFVSSLVPACGWLLNRLVAQSGQIAVTDNDLLTFVFSLPGVIFVLLSVGFALMFWFAEQAAMLMIVADASHGTKVSVSRVLWENVKHMPALLNLGLRQAVVYLLVAIPFGCGVGLTYWLLLTDFEFYYYLKVQPKNWWIAIAIVSSLGLVYLSLTTWLYIRWMLSIPILIFEKASPREALRKSRQQTRGRFWELAGPLAISWLVAVFASWVMTWLIGAVAAWLVEDSTTLAVLIPVVIGTLVLVMFVSLAWFVIGKIMHVVLMARAYLDTTELGQLQSETEPSASRPLPIGLRRAGLLVACAVLIVTGIASGTAFVERINIDRTIEITGHRGNKRRAPENTLSALKQAIAEGADYAEIDVQTTAYGVVVLLHDADLMRVASVNKRLNETNYAQLKDIDVGSSFDPKFSSERIPTLQEAIDLCRGRMKLNIEVKYTWADPELASKVGQIVRRNNFTSQCVISSLKLKALKEIKQSFPELTTGFIVFRAIGNLSSMEADFLSISAAEATPELVKAEQRRGGEVHVWTVNDPSNLLSMIEMGVDNIITDERALIRRLLKKWNELSGIEKLVLMLRNLIIGLEPPAPDEL